MSTVGQPGRHDASDVDALVNRVIRGDRAALADLFALYYPRLWRVVQFRLHPRLRGRLDAEDVLQDAYLRAESRIGSFVTEASRSSFVWFRMITGQALADLHRRHLGADRRDARREMSIDGRWSAESTATSLAFHLAANLPSPSSAAMRAERAGQLDDAILRLSELDREVLVLRHFEELTNVETAIVLGITEQAASNRYVRALGRLKGVLDVLAPAPPGDPQPPAAAGKPDPRRRP